MAAINKRIGFCSILLVVVAAIALLYGLLYSFIPTPMPYHLQYMGMNFDEIRNSNPGIAEMLIINLRVVGVGFLSIGLLLLGIALGPFRRAERWVWFFTLPALLVLLIPLLLISIKVGGTPPIAASGLSLALHFF